MRWNQKFFTPRPSLAKDEIIRDEFSVGLIPSARFTIAWVCMLTMMNLFLLRTHFNFAMVCMVKPPASPGTPNSTNSEINDAVAMTKSETVLPNVMKSPFVDKFFGDQVVVVTSFGEEGRDSLGATVVDGERGVGLGGESVYDVYGTGSLPRVSTADHDQARGEKGDSRAWTIGRENPSEDNAEERDKSGDLTAADACSHVSTPSTLSYEGEFEWSRPMQGALFGSFYYGYISSMIIGGIIGDLISAKWLMLIGTTTTGFLTVMIPSAAWFSPHSVVAVRALQGIASGLSLPCVHQLMASWASPAERPILMGLAYSGVSLGYAISSPFASFFCSSSESGWPWIFFFSGAWSCMSVGFILAFIYDSPTEHPRISQEEKDYLLAVAPHCQMKEGEKHVIPWRQLLTSMPFISICVCHFCMNWGFYVLAIMLPTYMKEVLKFDVKENGILSALPYIGTAFVQLTMGRPIEWMRRRRKWSTTSVRKACNTFGMLAPALALITLTSVNCSNRYVGVLLTVAAQSLLGICLVGGFFVNHADLAPRYAGTMMGITNTIGNIQGFLAPQLTTVLTPEGTREEWLVVFYIGAAAYAFGAIFFLIFGSGDVQPWADHGKTPSDKEKQRETTPKFEGFIPEDLADAILAAVNRKSGVRAEPIQMRAMGEDAEVAESESVFSEAAFGTGEPIHRQATRCQLKPMVPCAGAEEQKGW